jgi:transposase, IS5 family
MLVLQALHGLSLDQRGYLVGDRLSWMRFCGLGPGDAAPDANTLWDFREALIRAKTLDGLFARLDRAISEAGDLPMSGQIVDATLLSAPRQRNTDEEKAEIKAGKAAGEIWPDEPAKAAQKDTDARWTVRFSKAKPTADGTPLVDIAIPTFGYKAHISIDRRHGVIRRRIVTDAAAHDGARLREGLIDPNNTASDVWADTAYRPRQTRTISPISARSVASIAKSPKASRCPAARRGPTPGSRWSGHASNIPSPSLRGP